MTWSRTWRRSMGWGSGFESSRVPLPNDPPRFPHLFWKVRENTNENTAESLMKSRLFASYLDEKIIFGMETHVGAKSALLRRLFLPAAQKAAGRVAPLLLLPAKSLVCSGCSLASAVATPPLHYQLFAEKGKGIVFNFSALSLHRRIAVLRSKMGVP